MTKWKKWAAAGLAAGVLVPTTNGMVVSAAAPEVKANAAFMMDMESGKVLMNQNGDEQLGIASMTKMLVEYILFEAIENGDVTWDQQVKISEYAHQVSQNYILSNVPLRVDETYSIRELYEAMAIYSANGATIAIAEAIAGSEPAFVDMMREKVESWGITDYALYNTTGLNNEYLFGNHYPGSSETDENSMTARGIATVATRLLEDYPQVLETSSIPEKVFREGAEDAILMKNWNWMLDGLLWERDDVDGLKTGTTEYAGAAFTGTAKDGDARLVTVVMGAGDGQTNKGQRFEETDKMLDYGFSSFDRVTALEENQLIDNVEPLEVVSGKEETVPLAAGSEVELVVPKNVSAEDMVITFEPNADVVDEEGRIEAPVKQGTEVGTFYVSYEGDDLGYLQEDAEGQAVKAVAGADVEKANFFIVAFNSVKDFFGGLFSRFG